MREDVLTGAGGLRRDWERQFSRLERVSIKYIETQTSSQKQTPYQTSISNCETEKEKMQKKVYIRAK